MEFAKFTELFAASLALLADSESVTKRELKGLSRSLLDALYNGDGRLQGDPQFINALLPVLTPVNRKVAVHFFTHFSGFHFDEVLARFTKKSEKRKKEAREHALQFLADPNQNIWTWAERHIEVQPAEWNLLKVTKMAETALKKAQAHGLTQGDVLRAVFAAGITHDTILQVMQGMIEEGEKKREEAKKDEATM